MAAFNSRWKYEKLAVVIRVRHFTFLFYRGQQHVQRFITAELLFCSLNLLFAVVLVAVVVVVCLSSLVLRDTCRLKFD